MDKRFLRKLEFSTAIIFTAIYSVLIVLIIFGSGCATNTTKVISTEKDCVEFLPNQCGSFYDENGKRYSEDCYSKKECLIKTKTKLIRD